MATPRTRLTRTPPKPPPPKKPERTKAVEGDEVEDDEEQTPHETLREALDNIERWSVTAQNALEEIEQGEEE